jgi:hypothetical protein
LAVITELGLAVELPASIQIHGFAQLNPISTTANNFFGKTEDNASLEFWEVGINGSWRPTNNLLLSAQLASRRAGREDDGTVRLDYGLLSYSFLNSPTNRVGVRVGRVLNPYGFYNETRDVAFTRTSILLPQSIYFDRTRDLALSSDGVQLFGQTQAGFGDFVLQLNVGLPRTDDDSRTERALMGIELPGDIEGTTSVLGRLIYERDAGRWRFGISSGSIQLDYSSKEPVDLMPDGELDFQPLIFSAQYNAEKFSLTTEFGQRIFKSSGFGRAKSTMTGESGYIEGVYRFTPQWEAFARYDTLIADRDDRDGNKFAAADRLGRPAHSRFAKDLALGVTWRANNSLLFRAEYHYVDGTAWLPIADNPFLTDWEQYWSIFAFQMAVRF